MNMCALGVIKYQTLIRTHARTHAQNNTLYTKLDWLIVRLKADRCHYYLSKKVKYHGCVVCQDTSCS